MKAINCPIEYLHKGDFGCCNKSCPKKDECRLYDNFLSMDATQADVAEIKRGLPNRFDAKIFWGNSNQRCFLRNE